MTHDSATPHPHKQNCHWKATTTHSVDTVHLVVSGVCQEPTPGYKLTLTRHEPPGINPNILLLDLHVQAPHGIEPDHVTPTPVEFQETIVIPHGHVPKQVTILPDQGTIDVHPQHQPHP